MIKKSKILLSFDLEEFDLPLEYGQKIDKNEQFYVTTEGLKILLNILKKYKIKATFFTTAYYAENHPKLIEKIVSQGHELASHMYYHSDYNKNHILESKIKLEEISKTKVNGIRMPKLKSVNQTKVKAAGYLYDSSLNPTYLPGRYNNLNKNRVIYTNDSLNLIILPISTSIFRIPLFWLSFKNFNQSIYLFLCKLSLKRDNYLLLYFHPWEFAEIKNYKIPLFIKRNSGKKMIERFENLLNNLVSYYDFMNITDFIFDQNVR